MELEPTSRPEEKPPTAAEGSPEPLPEIDFGSAPAARPRPSAAVDLDADRRASLIAHRTREDAKTRDAQLELGRHAVVESKVLLGLLALPLLISVPAGLVLTFNHWTGIFAALAAGACLYPLRRWRRWLLEPCPAIARTADIAPDGAVDRPLPGNESPEAVELIARRAVLRESNDALLELQRRRGVAWRQVGAAAVGWLGGMIIPLLTGVPWSELLSASAGGAAACAAAAWFYSNYSLPVPVIGILTTVAMVTGTLLFGLVGGNGLNEKMAMAVPLASILTVFLGMGVGWWIEHTDDTAPQRVL